MDINFFKSMIEEIDLEKDDILQSIKEDIKTTLRRKTNDEKVAFEIWNEHILNKLTSNKDVEILYEKIFNSKFNRGNINVDEYKLDYDKIYTMIYPTVKRKIEERVSTKEEVVKVWLFDKHNFFERINTTLLLPINIKLILEKRILS